MNREEDEEKMNDLKWSAKSKKSKRMDCKSQTASRKDGYIFMKMIRRMENKWRKRYFKEGNCQ